MTGAFTTGFYNRGTCVGRVVSVTGVSAGSGGTVTIKGLDIHGYPMTQTITLAAGVNTVNTTKAFKIVTSVTLNFTDPNNVSIGTGDVFGFGLLASFFGDVSINWNSAVITASTGFLAAVTTNPSTALLGDVRGTYATQDASDGTKRLIMRVCPTLGLARHQPDHRTCPASRRSSAWLRIRRSRRGEDRHWPTP